MTKAVWPGLIFLVYRKPRFVNELRALTGFSKKTIRLNLELAIKEGLISKERRAPGLIIDVEGDAKLGPREYIYRWAPGD